MVNIQDGKTAEQWIQVLESGSLAERCAAALALGHLLEGRLHVKQALTQKVNDTNLALQCAAQIAIGFIGVPEENQRKMFDHLLGADEAMRETMLATLESLTESGFQGTASVNEDAPDTSARTSIDVYPPPMATPLPAALPDAAEMPDISVVYVFPWWFLIAGAALCLTLAWFFRGVSWLRWTMVGGAAVASLLLLYSFVRLQLRNINPKQFRAHARVLGTAIIACLGGFTICASFATGTILLDNESGQNVRLLIDGEDWATISNGESKRKALATGKHRLTVQTIEGNRRLEELDIEVKEYRHYVLNVLGGQIYFHGVVNYGAGGADHHVITASWFEMPQVDYLYRNPPERIFSEHPVKKSYFTKGAPPKFQNDER